MGTARLSFKRPVAKPLASERIANGIVSDGWSEEFVTAFSQFGMTADESFIAPDELSPDYHAERAAFE